MHPAKEMDHVMNDLVCYHIARPGFPLAPIEAGLYEYILAGNGIFVRGERKEFRAQFCIQPFEVRGLPDLEPRVELKMPRVPSDLVLEMLRLARTARDSEGEPCEIVFHLECKKGVWLCHVPEQTQSPMSAKPKDDSPDSTYARACIEAHSHVDMHASFSQTDDRDEQGFRVYAVLGCVSTRPAIRVRVGLYGYRHDVPASWAFDLPPGIGDAVTGAGTLLGSLR
jgi:PRTRC genetic system protein A